MMRRIGLGVFHFFALASCNLFLPGEKSLLVGDSTEVIKSHGFAETAGEVLLTTNL